MNKRALSISAAALVLFAGIFFLLPKPLTEPFTQTRLDALNRSSQPVLVAIHADWCSTCKMQERILQEMLPQPEFKRITMLRRNFGRKMDGVSTTGWSVILAMPAIPVVLMTPAVTTILASMMTPIIMIVIRNDAATQTNYDQACD